MPNRKKYFIIGLIGLIAVTVYSVFGKETSIVECSDIDGTVTIEMGQKIYEKCKSEELELLLKVEALVNKQKTIEELLNLSTEMAGKTVEKNEKSVIEEQEVTMYRNQHINPLPKIVGNTPAKRFNNLVKYFGYDPERFVVARNKYGVKEEMVACVIWADTGFVNFKSFNNPGNVGNTDSGKTKEFGSLQQGINAIGQTLTNKYLGHYTMVGELSNGGRKVLGLPKGTVYATSEYNWNVNVLDCLSFIYGERINEDFSYKG